MRKNYLRYVAAGMSMLVCTTSINAIPVNAKTVDLSAIEEKLDTDKDGLADYLEVYFETDKTKADTDGDGISDFVEISQLHTDPLKKDSDIDLDQDGVTNLEELKLGTDLLQADTDQDGLADGDEVKKYHTDPLKADTDGDGLADGEEIQLKLSPVKKATDQVHLDSEKTFAQVLDKDNIEEALLSKENEAVPSLSGNVQGVMESNVKVENATVVLEPFQDAMVGMPIKIVSEYQDGTEMKLSFACNNSSMSHMKKYRIAHVQDGKVRYLKTKNKCKTVSAKITEDGTYFVADKASMGQSVKILALASTEADSDFDGIMDAKDPTPYDNSFTGIINNPGYDINSNVSYAIDYRAFFNPDNEFNSQLCKAACIYANMAYEFTMKDQASGRMLTLPQLMEYQGLSHVSTYDLEKSYSDYDVAKFFMGHRTVTYNGVAKNVIVVSVKGTDSGIKQWQSNFDIGTTAAFSKYSDWTTMENHKGFDIPANRMKRIMESYANSYCANGNETVYLVTGHSRGGAIANIVGAKLKEEGKKAFAYTFATPNTTTKSTANTSRYNNIFNVVNKDDFVPCLPCTAWSFRRYGRTSLVSLADNYEEEWETLTDKFDYNPDTHGMQDTVDALADIFKTRDDAYIYTCKCHGNGSKNDITVRNYGTSKDSREEAIAKIPSNALPWGIITRYKGKLFWGWDFDNCQTPQYFMQVLAAEMAGTISTYRFVVELDTADRYKPAKKAIIESAISGLKHPHYSETYYVLAKHASAADFS